MAKADARKPKYGNARAATRALLAARAPDKSVCPSEVAKSLVADSDSSSAWRAKMPEVHAAVDRLVREGKIRLSWKGQPLAHRAGPYRIRRA